MLDIIEIYFIASIKNIANMIGIGFKTDAGKIAFIWKMNKIISVKHIYKNSYNKKDK